MAIKNVEIKARCENPDRIRQILTEHGARFIGTDRQIDTYFDVLSGRLKLRQGEIENALIYYNRSDQAGPTISDVQLYRTTDAAHLYGVLDAALPKLIVVEKRREIFFIDHVKFHLDNVNGLGTFIEIEVIDKHGSMDPTEMAAQCAHFMQLFGIRNEDLEKQSYSDLLLNKT